MGGHSGLNINEDRGNAVRFAARIADTLLEATPGARLVEISGGDKRNAIPREATALLLVGFNTPPSPMLCITSVHRRAEVILASLSDIISDPAEQHAPV